MNLLITGATGFVGKYVMSQLTIDFPDCSIITIGKDSLDQTEAVVRIGGEIFLKGDIQRELNEVFCVIHLASYTPKDSSQINEYANAFESMAFTSNLLDLDLPKLQRIIFFSSMDVYLKDEYYVNESSQTVSSNAYTSMKLLCESKIALYCNKKDISLKILRVGHIYGAGDDVYKKIVPTLFQCLRNGDVFEVNSGLNHSLNLIYVKDVASIVSELVVRDDLIEISNLVSSDSITVGDLIARVEAVTKQNLNFKEVFSKPSIGDYKFNNSNLVGKIQYKETSLDLGLLEMYGEEVE